MMSYKKKSQFVYILILFCYFSFNAFSDSTVSDKPDTKRYEAGIFFYEQEDFTKAREIFTQLTRMDSKCSTCFHMLGKSIGRIAEQSDWINAIGLAPKVKKALETALYINPDSEEIKKDLIKYYENAPFFLGGNKKKAKFLKGQLSADANFLQK